MLTYVQNLLPRLQVFSKELNYLTFLKDQRWVKLANDFQSKHTYIFKSKNKLLVSIDGVFLVGNCSWELIDGETMRIEINDTSLLYTYRYLDKYILALKCERNGEFIVFLNETKSNQTFDSNLSIENFLHEKYPSVLELPGKKHEEKFIKQFLITCFFLVLFTSLIFLYIAYVS